MRALLVALLVLSAGSARAAAAEPGSDGEQLYQRGERAFRNKQWEEARRAFAAAYELDRKPELLYDVAIAAWRRAREDGTAASMRAARDAYARYLTEAPEGRSRKQAQQTLALIETEMGPDSAPDTGGLPPGADDSRRPLDPYAPLPAEGKAARAASLAASAPADGAGASTSTSTTTSASTSTPLEPGKSQQPRWVVPVAVVAVLAVVALAVGLGVGLSSASGSSDHAALALRF